MQSYYKKIKEINREKNGRQRILTRKMNTKNRKSNRDEEIMLPFVVYVCLLQFFCILNLLLMLKWTRDNSVLHKKLKTFVKNKFTFAYLL